MEDLYYRATELHVRGLDHVSRGKDSHNNIRVPWIARQESLSAALTP